MVMKGRLTGWGEGDGSVLLSREGRGGSLEPLLQTLLGDLDVREVSFGVLKLRREIQICVFGE